MLIRYLCLLTFFTCAVVRAYAQNFSERNFSVEDGLPHSRVVVLNEDSNGYLWIGTYGGGVSRFDGREFESFDESNGLISSVVLGIEIDSHNNAWICTPLGISKFDGTSFRNFRGHFDRGFFGIDVYEHHDTIYTLTKAQGDWRFGVIYGDSIVGRNYTFGQKQSITNAFAADNDTLYLNLATGDVIRKTKKEVTVARGLNVIRFFKSKFGTHALTADGIYDITEAGVILRHRIADAEWITIDRDFSFGWIRKGGMLSKISFSKSDSIGFVIPFPSSYTFIDSEGNSWFGTIGKGLIRLSDLDFVNLLPGSRSVYSFVKDPYSNIWTGSDNGIEILDAGTKRIKTIDLGDVNRNSVHSLVVDSSGAIWAGTLNGLAQIRQNGKQIHWFTTINGLNSNRIRALEIDSEGRIWIAYMNGAGLSIFDGKKNARLSLKDGLLTESVWDLRYSKSHKTMFVCTDLGVQKFKSGVFEAIRIPEFTNKILLSLGLYMDRYLLIGSGGSGLAVVDSTSRYSILTKKDGLSSNFIYLADADSEGTIWAGTVKGIDKFSLSENLTITNLRHFGSQNGLSANGVNTNAYLLDKRKIFGLTEGAYMYLENTGRQVAFPLHFTRIYVNNQPLTLDHDPVFLYNQNHFEFHFNKVNKGGAALRYQYMLDNWDIDWVRSGEINRATYGNLLPGKYGFRVRVASSDGIWSDEIRFDFQILEPVYQRMWFKILMLLLVLICVVAFFYLRIRIRIHEAIVAEKARNEESQRLRKEIGKDFHDEVGNQLARLINYIGLIKMPNSSNRPGILEKMEETAKYLLGGTKDFIWSIDPAHDNLDSLAIHIRDFGEKLLEEKLINFRFIFDASPHSNLPAGYTRQVNLIFKEALTNVFKHSQAKCVILEIRQKYEQVEISLTDDGISISDERIESGDGLRNMRLRASKINGELQIINVETGGLEVRLTFKL